MAQYPKFTGSEPCTSYPELMFYDKNFAADADQKRVKELCKTCDIQAECLDWGLRVDVEFGIWGGMSVAERKKYRQKHKIPAETARYGVDEYLRGYI